eukprot:TRINITY_DN2895_c0_g1_i4.p4 TRINITY_DN2895_c0_g1~~TRINITY_DN2895_c0_g1_i4.p4  ORF type:complete len:130 (+),score=19.68 TRINITY_DN2895_c0_g1_i4:138-527(+)
MDRVREQFQREVENYRDLQRQIQTNYAQNQKFAQQQQESQMVLEELQLLDEEAKVYKLVGPVLIKQDKVEAKTNINTRLDYIKREQERIEGTIKQLESKAQQKEREVARLREQYQEGSNIRKGSGKETE